MLLTHETSCENLDLLVPQFIIYACLKAKEKVQIITAKHNDDCNSSDKDFNGIYEQQEGHSVLALYSVEFVNFSFKHE